LSVQDLEGTARALRSVELRRTLRGVDPDQARKLLEEAADSLEGAIRQQQSLRKELEHLRGRTDQEDISKALLAATRTGEEIVVDATKRAASITAEAEAQAAALLQRAAAAVEERERETAAARKEFDLELASARQGLTEELEAARAEAESALESARRELARLEDEAARLRSLVGQTEQHVLEIVQAALGELENLEPADSGAEAANADLLSDLHPAAD
jgi:cell division septum initiation protein DivIVA